LKKIENNKKKTFLQLYYDFSEYGGDTPEAWKWRLPFNTRAGSRTGIPLDEFMRDITWKVPPPPPYYDSSQALTGDQLALVLRHSDPHPFLAL